MSVTLKNKRWVGGVAIVVFVVLSVLLLEAALFNRLAPLAKTPRVQKDRAHLPGLPRFNQIEEGKFVSKVGNGWTAVHTLDPVLQKTMEDYFKKYRVPYGVFVAMEPDTGKVIAMAEYSSKDPNARNLSLTATYPAASIFKLVTAAAAVEEGKASPNTSIAYHGNIHRLRPEKLVDSPRRDRQKSTLSEALARSNNVVFAKVALRWLTVPMLLAYGERFQFNHAIPFDLPIQVSRMSIKANQTDLARGAAGFGEVYLSPLHAALIGATIANDGVMMAPCLVEAMRGPQGKVLNVCPPKVIAPVISEKTARLVREMMAMTVMNGTSRRAFRDKKREASLRGISIGGKTGSLTGKTPPGKYSWFVGLAPVDSPEIVVSALVINQGKWKIKASDVAKKGLATYFASEPLTQLARR